MKIKSILILILISAFSACQRSHDPLPGDWRAILIPDSTRPELEIPFRLSLHESAGGSLTATIHNAGEEIRITETWMSEDSIHFRLPVFEGTIDARKGSRLMQGTYTHRSGGKSWTIPFSASLGISERFPDLSGEPKADLTGRWEVTAGAGDQTEKQIGEFWQKGNHLTGTILTTTGDYRYLEGKVAGEKLALSAFDGAHALIFEATLTDDGTISNGIFCGGPNWKGTWQAVRNDTVTLPDPTTLTFLKPGYDRIDFSFPDTEGKPVSLTDPQYAGKPVIIQIMGSWCPNCMDEARFFSELYREYHDNGLEIIALCYESGNLAQSVKAINRFRTNLDAGYTFLYAGESNKRKASETLPMLNRILSYPTSLFIGKDGTIRKIFTGFSGPGTGEHYHELTAEMRKTVEEIIQ